MRLLLILWVLLSMMIFSTQVFAQRAISLPFEEKFDSGDTWTSDLSYAEFGGTATHLSSDAKCWSGGCAKIIPPTSLVSQGRVGFGSATFSNQRRVNIRLLVRIGSTYHSTATSIGWGVQNKFIILSRSGERGMLMLARSDAPYHYTFGPCGNDNDECRYNNTPVYWWPQPVDVFKNTSYADQWISVEYETDLDNRVTKLYLFTQDGSISGLYSQQPLAYSTGYFTGVEVIGGFFNGMHAIDDNTYIMLDEIKISNTYIGPPIGFVGRAAKPSPPLRLTVINLQN